MLEFLQDADGLTQRSLEQHRADMLGELQTLYYGASEPQTSMNLAVANPNSLCQCMYTQQFIGYFLSEATVF